jgi:Flp pilus assembly protein TadB
MFARGNRSAAPAIEELASLAARLAVLLAAGVGPSMVWEYLADDDAHPVVAAAAGAAREGENVAAAIASASRDLSVRERAAWNALAAVWFVAVESGAPLADCLRSTAGAFRSLAQTERDLGVALAGPASTARLVAVLPVIGLLFGAGLGFDTLRTLFATPPGWGCLTAGVALMIAARLWNRWMIRRATSTDPSPGLVVDLIAVAMAGGGSAAHARQLVAEAIRRFGISAVGSDAVGSVFELAHRAGVPVAELMRSEAERIRLDARASGQRSAASLAVRLMMPLALCVLPAFMLLAVAPLMLSIISSTIATF